ncbi:unnamed protein product [Echinostoma caproni]|uniref:Integrase catalytic domain-containing protein n=1 Tax=Echinostoma caproni TaxID=27848 RepID=A0A183AX38_9TREM|nr:unnamed protein product [Echinostoma caproni]
MHKYLCGTHFTIPSKWTPWPVSSESWQRIHVDHGGPFFNMSYALVIVDSYSRWPELYFNTSPSSEFTIRALRKTFSREGVSHAIVTDNGSHFTAKKVSNWLNSVSIRHVLTPLRYPQSNGAAENFVCALKSAIASLNPSTFDALDTGVDNFLMQYRKAVHSTTGHSPAKLFKSRVLRRSLLHLESAEVVYYRGNNLLPSRVTVLDNMGQRRNYIPVQMSKTIQKNPEDLNDYSTKPALITENRSFIEAVVDVVIAHEL